MNFKIGDKVKNRFRQNKDFLYTQTGMVVGFEGCLVLIKIDKRSYAGFKFGHSFCVPSDWALITDQDRIA